MIHETFSETFDYNKTYNKLILNFDGSCGPRNPNGDMGFGWAIRIAKSQDYIAEGWGYELYDGRKETSNNLAEWYALYYGLKWLLDNDIQFVRLNVFGDSNLVIKQCRGEWRISQDKAYSEGANLYLNEIKPFFADKSHNFYWEGRSCNEYCDFLSNKFKQHIKNLLK